MTTDIRPPIPMSCQHRPTVGGLVAPWINTVLADGGVDFRMPRRVLYKQALDESLCQTCGQQLPPVCVVFGGPNQLHNNHFDEPPLCPPCAVYASTACPMVAGRQPRYANRATISQGPRGHVCPDSSCQCDGYSAALTNQLDGPRGLGGEPAHPWYALHVRTGAWQITAHDADVRCTPQLQCKPGCGKTHQTLVYNGIRLTEEPRRVTLVSTPTDGRVWRRIPPDQAIPHLLPWAAR